MFFVFYINIVQHLLSYCVSALNLLFYEYALLRDAEPKTLQKHIFALPTSLTTQQGCQQRALEGDRKAGRGGISTFMCTYH